MDLSALDTKKGADEGFELQITHVHTGVPLPLWLTVCGMDSDIYQSTLRAQQRKRMDRLNRGKRLNLTPEDIDNDALELLAAVTRSWRGEMKLDGGEFPSFS